MAARLTGLRTRPANRPLSAPLLSCSAVTRMQAQRFAQRQRNGDLAFARDSGGGHHIPYLG